MTHGVYTLANDGVLGWFVPMVASLRRHEPDLALRVIPFDDRVEALAALADRYRFELWTDPSLTRLDEIGVPFTPTAPPRRHLFRKLAAFWGPFERFLFLDSDIVVLDRLAPLFRAAEHSDADLLYADADLDTVYQPGPFREHMLATYRPAAWQSGVFLARSGLVDLEGVERARRLAQPNVADLTRWDGEQSFLNFVGDVNGWRYARLADLDPGIAPSVWARQPLARRGVRYHPVEGDALDPGATVPLLHWAGDRASPLMPHARIYLRHALATMSPPQRARFLVVTWPWAGARLVLGRLTRRLRRYR